MAMLRFQMSPSMYFVFFCILSFTIGGVQAKNYSMVDPKVSISWEVHDERDEITIQATFRKNVGWAALGFHCVGCGYTGMSDADYVVAQVDEQGRITVGDFFSNPRESGYAAPIEDTRQNGVSSLLSSSGYISGKDLTFRFTRKLNTGDSRDHIFRPGEMSVIYAYSFGNTGGLSYHSSHVGSVVVNFWPEQKEAEENILNVAQEVM